MKTCCEYYFSDRLRVRSERFKKHIHVAAAAVTGGADVAQAVDTGCMASCAHRFKKPAAVAACQQAACTVRVLGWVQSAVAFKNKVIGDLRKEMDSVTVGAMEAPVEGEKAPASVGKGDEDEDEDEDNAEEGTVEEVHPLVSHPILSQPPFLNSRQAKEIRRKFEEIDESGDGALDKGITVSYRSYHINLTDAYGLSYLRRNHQAPCPTGGDRL